VFGPATEYAATVAAERTDERRHSLLDLEGKTPHAHFREGMKIAAVAAALTAVATAVADPGRTGWMPLINDISACVLLIVGFAVFPALRAGGRLRAAWYWAAGGAAMAVGAGAAHLTPIRDVGSFPALPLIPILCGALLAQVGASVPDRTLDRWFVRSGPGHLDDEEWLRQLSNVLRGRHGVTRCVAMQHVAEARRHLAATDHTAHKELGQPDTYARDLAGNSRRDDRQARRVLLTSGATVPLSAVPVFVSFTGDQLAGISFWVHVTWFVTATAQATAVGWKLSRQRERPEHG
jgi:hypothetical protein